MTHKKKTALITGITGQDGAYLAELLLAKGYAVHGIKRRSSSFNTERIDHLYQDPHFENRNLFLHYGDMTDSMNLIALLQKIQPDEIYNLAGQGHGKNSFETPEYTANCDALGALRLLEAIRILELPARFYQASSSELFGQSDISPQNEKTPFAPRNPHATAKLFAYWNVINYREIHNIHASNGIVFNHESPICDETFIGRKITRAAATHYSGSKEILYLGSLDARRDWGHARDYVVGMWQMLQQHAPDDYVLATGHSHSVRDFIEMAYAHVGIDIGWRYAGIKEQGIDAKSGKVLVAIDPCHFVLPEADDQLGDATKAFNAFGWQPQISFRELVKEMVETDVNQIKIKLNQFAKTIA